MCAFQATSSSFIFIESEHLTYLHWHVFLVGILLHVHKWFGGMGEVFELTTHVQYHSWFHVTCDGYCHIVVLSVYKIRIECFWSKGKRAPRRLACTIQHGCKHVFPMPQGFVGGWLYGHLPNAIHKRFEAQTTVGSVHHILYKPNQTIHARHANSLWPVATHTEVR